MNHILTKNQCISGILVLMLTGCASISSEKNEPSTSLLLANNSAKQQQSFSFPKGTKRLYEPLLTTISSSSCTNQSFALNELSVKNIGLSNTDDKSARELLTLLGYRVISTLAETRTNNVSEQKYNCNELPLIVVPDDTAAAEQSLPPQQANMTGTGNLQIAPLKKSNAADSDQLFVFYHDSQGDKISRLEQAIFKVVDAAAPQVYIETMVLEVSEEDSKELGIAYSTNNIGGANGNNRLSLGGTETGISSTLDFIRDTTADVSGSANFIPGQGIQAEVRALVDNGKAEVLARPSILALSNRQAVIQIVDVIQSPIVQSSVGGSGELVISAYSFEPQLLGITLNLRPRVSADREWVSMEIDASVEAEIDENSGAVFAPDGEGGTVQLAEKKGASSRKVKTAIRIPDRTPIVIGGLVAGKEEKQNSSVPVLGDLPLIGGLFGATDNERQKREIIIVITPHVLAEDAISVRANTANDEVMKRQSDLMLFNNTYRVTQSDVFDMNFLLADANFVDYRNQALQLIKLNPKYEEDPVIRTFTDNLIPGDAAIVSKMIFDIAAKQLSYRAFEPELIMVSIDELNGKQGYVSLAEIFEVFETQDEGVELYFDDHSGEIKYRVVNNQERDKKIYEQSIILTTELDKQRLYAAIMTDIIIHKNGGFTHLNSQTFRPGVTLTMDSQHDYQGYKLTKATLEHFLRAADYANELRLDLDYAYQHIDRLYAFDPSASFQR